MDWRKEWLSRSFVPSTSNQLEFAKLANKFLQPTDSVLIVGCGDGMLAKRLIGSVFIGVDLNPHLNKNEDLIVQAGDAVSLPFKTRGYDAVLLNSVLHYLSSKEEIDVALKEAERVADRVVVLGDLVNPLARAGDYVAMPRGFYAARGYTVTRQHWNTRCWAIKNVRGF